MKGITLVTHGYGVKVIELPDDQIQSSIVEYDICPNAVSMSSMQRFYFVHLSMGFYMVPYLNTIPLAP